MTNRLWIAVAALCLASLPAFAQNESGKPPMKIEAEMHFNRALELYQSEQFRQAAEEFSTAYGIESRVETLFAWAQSERLAGKCEKATELYHELRKKTLPDQDRLAVLEGLERCGAFDRAEQATIEVERIEKEGTPWYSDWIGDALLIGGVVGLGVGTSFWLTSSSERGDADEAFTYESHVVLEDRARRDRFIAIGSYIASVGLIGGAIARYVTRDDGARAEATEPEITATSWVDRGAAGFAVGGRF